MLKTVGKWLILIALLAYAVVAAVWVSGKNRDVRCTGIEVLVSGETEAGEVTRRGILDELVNFDKGILKKTTDEIDTRKIEDYLRQFSNFESVECLLTTAGKLRINVVPIVPELRVFTGDDSYYINKDGKRIRANAEFFADVPVVAGRFTDRFPPQALLPVTRAIAADSLVKNLVAMVEVADADNILLIPRVKGHVINIGDRNNLKDKFHRLKLMYTRVMPYRGWNAYDTVSVKFKGQIVATRRDKKPLHPALEVTEEADLEEAALQGASGTDEAASSPQGQETNAENNAGEGIASSGQQQKRT